MIAPSWGQQEAGSGARLGRPWDGFLEEEGQLASSVHPELEAQGGGSLVLPSPEPGFLIPRGSFK